MPFEEAEIITKNNAPPTAKITYQRGGHADTPQAKLDEKKPKLHVTIPTTVIGVCKRKHFALLIGTGDDAGKLLVRGIEDKKVTKDHVAPSEHAHFLKFNFGFVVKLGETEFDGGQRPVTRIDDDNFPIDVPKSWFEQEE